eukprot:sb/3476461/
MANFVAKDDIWKIHMSREHTAAKMWEKKWGFLTSEYQDIFEGKEGKEQKENKGSCSLPPIEDGMPLCQQKVPKTSGHLVGWRIGTEKNLNPFGSAFSESAPRQDLAKKLGWPHEALI